MTPLPVTPAFMLVMVGLSFFSGALVVLVITRLVRRQPVTVVDALHAATAVLFAFAVSADRTWTWRVSALFVALLLLSFTGRRSVAT